MPELPEVETVRAGLAAHVPGRTITAVTVYRDRAVRRQAGGAAQFESMLIGRTITAVVRRGKFCWLLLSGPDGVGEDYALLAHLGMSGQLLVRSAPGGEHPHLRIRISMHDDGEVWFVDQRTFGYLTVDDLVPARDGGPGGFAGPAPGPGQPVRSAADPITPDPGVPSDGQAANAVSMLPRSVEHIGRDLLDPLLAPGTPGRAGLNRRLRLGRRELKRALLDQELTSGIGNIYADEALWRSRLHYQRRTDRLRPRVVDEVLDAATEVMREALVAGGTSFDALYVNVDGTAGYFDRALAVYGRAGQPCPRCGAIIVRESFMNRSSYFCPRCQRRPRRL